MLTIDKGISPALKDAVQFYTKGMIELKVIGAWQVDADNFRCWFEDKNGKASIFIFMAGIIERSGGKTAECEQSRRGCE